MYAIAFLQGREIIFWPQKIGEKPKSDERIKLISQEDIKTPLAYVFGTKPTSLDEEIDNFSDFCILGMNLKRTLTSYYGLLESKLSHGGDLKFLLIDPNSDVIQLIAQRNYVYRDP